MNAPESRITTDGPLYAAYRKAVLNRNDDEALKTLQSIARLNPSDTNAASELVRLDAKVLAARLDHLGKMLDGGTPALIVAAVEEIEAFGFSSSPDGETWSKAQRVRCEFLLDEAEKLKAALQWEATQANLDLIRRLQSGFKLELPAAVIMRLEPLETWAHAEQEKDLQNRKFGALLAELHQLIQKSEEKDTSARYVKLPELRDDFEALHKVWRSLLDFTRPIPEGTKSSFQKRSALLEAEISRRTALRRGALVAGSAVVIMVCAVIVWSVHGQIRGRDLAKSLQTAISQRQVRTAEHLLDRIRTSEKRLLRVGTLNTSVAGAESFVIKERALHKDFEAAFAKIPTQLEGAPDAARLSTISEQLAQARAALNALALDLKAENEPRIQAFDRQWQQFLSEAGVAVNTLFEHWVGKAEEQCSRLDYRAPIETAAAQISNLSAVIQKINDCEAGFTNHVSIRSDLLQRAATARAKYTTYNDEMRKIDQGMATLQTSRAFGDYASAISRIASSEFSGTPAVAAALSIQSLGASEEAALRGLLNATNAATWAFINQAKSSTFIPEMALPAELALLKRLSTDPAVSARHRRYRLWLDRENMRFTDWITAGVLNPSQGWKQIKACTPSPTATSATFEDREYGYFDGQWRLTPTQVIHKLEEGGEQKEASSFASVGLAKLWPGGTAYGESALAVLDGVKESRDGSPIFRAFLFCNLVELMEFQPDAWGLSFCPSARAHADEIRRIAGGQIDSGDWFVPSKAKGWNQPLDSFFTAQKPLSYAKQAAGNLALAQSVLKAGLRYAGFLGLDGKPVVIENPAPGELWGYSTTHKLPVLAPSPAMPLSPLFSLPISRAEFLTRAGVNANAPSFANALPPLFLDVTKP